MVWCLEYRSFFISLLFGNISPIPGGIQGQAGCGSGQPGLLVGDPAHSRGLELHEHCGPFQPRPFYDSMMAKLIVKGSTRMDAIKKLRRAVSETIIDGVPTNLGFIYAILYDKDFILGNIDTNYVAHKEAELLKSMHVTGE